MLESPLSHASHRAAMATMRRYPDRSSTLGDVSPAVSLTTRLALDVRLAFDDANRIVENVHHRRVGQAETLELLLTYAFEDPERFVAFVERVREGRPAS